MSTCKDCLHCEVCEFNDGLKKWCNPDYLCPHFKPKADYVEVVRCEKCVHKVDYRDRVMCNKNAVQKGDEWYGLTATRNHHFCSYGERKGGAE